MRRRLLTAVLFPLLAVEAWALVESPDSGSSITFQDVTAQAGIRFLAPEFADSQEIRRGNGGVGMWFYRL